MEENNIKSDRSQVYQVTLDSKAENDARIIASRYIPADSVVLDVGSACGDFGVFLHEQKNCEMHGMEFSRASLETARQTHAYSAIHEVDLNAFDERNFENYDSHFDCIALLDVLEHVLNPKQVLQRLKSLLKDDGAFVISLPNIAFGNIKLQLLDDNFAYTETGILDETHVRFFTFKSIACFLTELDIQILDCSVKVADVSTSGRKVPAAVRKFVLEDPHSFVYQYVLKAKPTNMDREVTSQINIDKMRINWPQINNPLGKIKRHNMINRILPPGSGRRIFAQKLLLVTKSWRY